MNQTARFVVALCLVFPLLASHAAPPDPEGPAEVREAGPAVTTAEPPLELSLPEELWALPLDQHNARTYRFLAAERAADNEMIAVPTIELPALPHGTCLAGGGPGESLCAAARRISHQRPCLAFSGDCEALEEWRQVMGAPGIRPAPEWTVQATERSVWVERPEAEPAERRRSQRQD